MLKYGERCRFRYFSVSYGAGSYYDDDVTLTKSGNDLWVSGLHFPLNVKDGSTESFLVEQGRLLNNDTKLYIRGDIESSKLMKIGLGSPIRHEYSIIPDGINEPKLNGEGVYKKLFIRVLPTGSIKGE